MAQTVKIRRSAVANRVPTTSSLALGELAVNTTILIPRCVSIAK